MRFVVLAALLLSATPALAQSGPNTEMESAAALGMGGAYRALALDTSAVDLNPAAMAQIKKFELEIGYWRDPHTKEYGLRAGMTDFKTYSSATGFNFEYVQGPRGPNGKPIFQTQRYALGVGTPVVPGKVFLGFNSKFAKVDYDARKGESAATTDMAILVRPAQIVGLAFSFDNLINGNSALSPRGLTGGVAVIPTQWAAVEADVFTDLATKHKESTGWAAGATLTPVQQLAIRGGAYQDALTGKRTWTAGIGLNSQTGAISYACRVPEGQKRIVTHYFTLSLLVF